MSRAQKWDAANHCYRGYELPEKAAYFRCDMEDIVQCAQCGGELKFGDSYTSMEIHTVGGFGYGVCGKCYAEEWERRQKGHE